MLSCAACVLPGLPDQYLVRSTLVHGRQAFCAFVGARIGTCGFGLHVLLLPLKPRLLSPRPTTPDWVDGSLFEWLLQAGCTPACKVAGIVSLPWCILGPRCVSVVSARRCRTPVIGVFLCGPGPRSVVCCSLARSLGGLLLLALQLLCASHSSCTADSCAQRIKAGPPYDGGRGPSSPVVLSLEQVACWLGSVWLRLCRPPYSLCMHPFMKTAVRFPCCCRLDCFAE